MGDNLAEEVEKTFPLSITQSGCHTICTTPSLHRKARPALSNGEKLNSNKKWKDDGKHMETATEPATLAQFYETKSINVEQWLWCPEHELSHTTTATSVIVAP